MMKNWEHTGGQNAKTNPQRVHDPVSLNLWRDEIPPPNHSCGIGYVTWHTGPHKSPWKQGNFSGWWQKRKAEGFEAWTGSVVRLTAEDGVGHVNVGGLWDLRVAPSPQPARKRGPESHDRRELGSCILSQVLQVRVYLDLTWRDPRQRPSWATRAKQKRWIALSR